MSPFQSLQRYPFPLVDAQENGTTHIKLPSRRANCNVTIYMMRNYA